MDFYLKRNPSFQQQTQLDFLLSKASEYSNFISKDLEELQAAMVSKMNVMFIHRNSGIIMIPS